MFFRRFFFVILFGLLLFIGFSGMRHQAGFAQGYEQGYTAAAQDFAPVESAAGSAAGAAAEFPSAPATSYRPGWGWGFYPVFGFFGLIFKFFLVFAAIGFFMKLLFFGFGRRRRWHGHKSGPGGHHRHWGKWDSASRPRRDPDNQPQKGDDDYEKQPEDVEPDVRSY
jgi:hypothetical protein